MKFKLSKKQWEQIGSTAGWYKTAQTFPPSGDETQAPVYVPATDLIDTSPQPGTEDQILEEMKAKGYHLYRDTFPFGHTLAVRNEQGENLFLYIDHSGGTEEKGTPVWKSWPQLKEILREEWRPVRPEDQAWFSQNIGQGGFSNFRTGPSSGHNVIETSSKKTKKTAHHESEYPEHILNMSVMQLLDKLESSPDAEKKDLYNKIEACLDTMAKSPDGEKK